MQRRPFPAKTRLQCKSILSQLLELPFKQAGGNPRDVVNNILTNISVRSVFNFSKTWDYGERAPTVWVDFVMHWTQSFKGIFLKITDDKVTSGPLSPLGWGLAMTNGQGRQLGGGCHPYSFHPEELFTWLWLLWGSIHNEIIPVAKTKAGGREYLGIENLASFVPFWVMNNTSLPLGSTWIGMETNNSTLGRCSWRPAGFLEISPLQQDPGEDTSDQNFHLLCWCLRWRRRWTGRKL